MDLQRGSFIKITILFLKWAPLKALKSKRTSDIVDAVNGSRVGAIKRGEIWSCHICYYFGKCKTREPRNGLVFILLRSLEYCKLQEPHLDWEEVNFSNPLAYHFFFAKLRVQESFAPILYSKFSVRLNYIIPLFPLAKMNSWPCLYYFMKRFLFAEFRCTL